MLKKLLWIPLGLGLLQIVVTATPVLRWWIEALANPWEDPKGEVLIVLAGDAADGAAMGPSSLWRAYAAAVDYRNHPFQRVFISGGDRRGTPVADLMKRYMVLAGVPESIVETETASCSTYTNARNTIPRVKDWPGRKVLLTSDLHAYRAVRVFRRQGLEVVQRPAPDAGKQMSDIPQRWTVFLRLCEETAKIAYYAIRGWI